MKAISGSSDSGQVRKFGAGFKRLFGSVNLNGEKADHEGMSSFQAVTTVDNIKFSGYVKDFAIQMQDNDVWRATITIKGSGQRVVTKAA